MTRTRWAALALAAACLLTACDDAMDSASSNDDSGESMTVTDDLVCGMIDVDLVRRIVGDAEIGTRGRGFSDDSDLSIEPASCTVQNLDLTQTVLQVSVGAVEDAEQVRLRLEADAAERPECTTYSGDPGYGYGCTYDRGVFVDGAEVVVIRSDHTIRVTVHHWPDVTPQERLTTAEDIARNIDDNVTA